jgi:hypothetical protein
MKKIIVLLLFISFQTYSQTNRFTGTWSNENCKNCSKEYIFTLNIAQSNYKIYGTVEITSSTKTELNSGTLEVSGYVYTMGERAQITLKGKNGISAGGVLFEQDGKLQFTKRGGDDIVPKEVVLTKIN